MNYPAIAAFLGRRREGVNALQSLNNRLAHPAVPGAGLSADAAVFGNLHGQIDGFAVHGLFHMPGILNDAFHCHAVTLGHFQLGIVSGSSLTVSGAVQRSQNVILQRFLPGFSFSLFFGFSLSFGFSLLLSLGFGFLLRFLFSLLLGLGFSLLLRFLFGLLLSLGSSSWLPRPFLKPAPPAFWLPPERPSEQLQPGPVPQPFSGPRLQPAVWLPPRLFS